MKANRRARTARILVAALLAIAGGACSDRRVVPSPSPTPAVRPSPAPVAPRPTANWRDVPITPGTWAWSLEGGQSVARFAGGALALRCDRASGTVTLLRAGSLAAGGSVPVTVQTTSTTRTLSGTAQASAVAAGLQARDSLLDALAFSRGRFAVEVAGLAPLYAPTWPEVSRVIEDCR